MLPKKSRKPSGASSRGTKPRPKRDRKNDLSPSKKLALSVLRVFTDPAGAPMDDLKELVDNDRRGFWNYKKRLEEVFSQFLSFQVDLEEVRDEKTGRKRLRLSAGDRARDAQWPLVARMAAYDFVISLLSGLGNTEIAAQVAAAEREFLARVAPNFALPFRRNLRRMFYVVPDAPKDYSAPQSVEVVNELVRSFWFGRRVKISYKPAGKPAAVHTVEPLTLALYRSALYLFARFPENPEKTYLFAIDRISKVERLKTKGYYKYPREDEWSPAEFTERSFGIFTPPRSKQEAIDVALVFENLAWLKAHVRERRWAKGQRFVELPDGRMRMEFTANSLIEVLPWVRQWGAHVTVEKPRKLAQELADA